MKPIIFSTPMVRALLNTKPGVWPAEPIDPGKPCKSMTRRIIKPRYRRNESGFKVATGKNGRSIMILNEEGGDSRYYNPPYDVGDILWVRETFTPVNDGSYLHRADPRYDGCGPGDFGWKWSSPRFMPREAARIFLEVKSVRIERLNEVSEEDATAEGVGINLRTSFRKDEFPHLWDSINGKKKGCSWEDSPWVFVYEFMRVNKQEDMDARIDN